MEVASLDRKLAVLRHELENQQQQVQQLPAARRAAVQADETVQKQKQEWGAAWRSQLHELAPEVPESPDQTWPRLSQVREELSLRRQALNETQLRQRTEQLEGESATIQNLVTQNELQERQAQQRQREALEKLNAAGEAPADWRQWPSRLPELEVAPTRSAEEWRLEAETRHHHVTDNRAARHTLAQQAAIGEELLELGAALCALDEAQRDYDVRKRATDIVSRSRQSLVSRVMPLTTHNMQRLLPVLTQNRYKDVQWDETGNRLAIYDSQARDYVAKRVFSGGARDQISLAMRLSFALATLPGEYNIRPGWLFLDEPLSSFDRTRTQSLVELLTAPRGDIRRNFPQIFLISHSESFDLGCFDHRVRLEGGRVVESTLPSR